MSNQLDPHHCRCFSVNPNDNKELKNQLEDLDFYQEIEENHGQVYGRVLRVEDKLQLHFKIMPNGNIEAEMEPPSAYPAAHVNQEHSYSAHHELQTLFSQYLRIRYYVTRNIPKTCINRIIKKPKNPTHAKTFAAVGAIAVIGIGLAYFLSKKDKKRTTL